MAAFVAFLKAIPAIKSLVDKFVEAYINRVIDEVKHEQATRKEKREVVMLQIQRAQTNEERRLLSIVLSEL